MDDLFGDQCCCYKDNKVGNQSLHDDFNDTSELGQLGIRTIFSDTNAVATKRNYYTVLLPLQAGRSCFPLELPTYTSATLQSHIAAEHAACKLCDRAFYDQDCLQQHMMNDHPYCPICGACFRTAQELAQHHRQDSGLLCSTQEINLISRVTLRSLLHT